MAVNFKNRIQQNVSGTPGTGTITLGTAVNGMLGFVAGDNSLQFDILITDGSNWELAGECTYTHSSTTITRGTFLSSSTGSALDLTSSANVSVVLLAERAIPFYITTPTTGQVLALDNNGKWVNTNQINELPDQTGHASQYLQTDGSIVDWVNGNSYVPFTTTTGSTNNIPLAGANSGDSLILADNLTLTSAADIFTTTSNYGWKDIISDINIRSQGGNGNDDPTWAVFRNGVWAFRFSASSMNECWINFHINHDYALGTPIYLHVHWSNSGTNTGVVRWGFEYTIQKGHQQGVFPATTTVYVEQAAVAQYEHQLAEINPGITSTDLEPDSLVLVRLFRDAPHANDTCTDSVSVFCSDLHYQASKFATKNKSPDFYT